MGVEIEKKYIIKMPDFKILSRQDSYTKSEIVQIYLEAAAGKTHRVRSRTMCGKTVYTETVKIRIDKMSSEEIENEITEERFLMLSANPRANSNSIRKVRHTFISGGQLFEIDEYPEWKRSCIMETELPTRDTVVSIPAFLNILREVTGDSAYSNSGMSKSFPKELEF